jgi:PAS domain S-box-containing protein
MRHAWVRRIGAALTERVQTWLPPPVRRRPQHDWGEVEHGLAHGARNDWWQRALAGDRTIAFQWDARSGLSQRSANAADILGFATDQTITTARFLAQIHGEDRPLLLRRLAAVRPDKAGYSISFRFIRLDGTRLWLEETARAEFDAGAQLVRLSGLTRDITTRKRLEEQQSRLLSECDHRVENVLARVAAVAKASREDGRSIDDFMPVFEGRLIALRDAHLLLNASKPHGVDLADLIRQQLRPYAAASNTSLNGPPVALSATATEALAMVLHELATNAAKYGALSVAHGKVFVIWGYRADGAGPQDLRISWQEVAGPPVAHPLRSGYGISLIRELIPRELGGKVDVAFATDGMRGTLELPGEHLSAAPPTPLLGDAPPPT